MRATTVDPETAPTLADLEEFLEANADYLAPEEAESVREEIRDLKIAARRTGCGCIFDGLLSHRHCRLGWDELPGKLYAKAMEARKALA
jgi:hypothetical protein